MWGYILYIMLNLNSYIVLLAQQPFLISAPKRITFFWIPGKDLKVMPWFINYSLLVSLLVASWVFAINL